MAAVYGDSKVYINSFSYGPEETVTIGGFTVPFTPEDDRLLLSTKESDVCPRSGMSIGFRYKKSNCLHIFNEDCDCSISREDVGALVLQVEPDSPAEKADIRIGDELLSINGLEIFSRNHLWEVLNTNPALANRITGLRSKQYQIVWNLVVKEIPHSLIRVGVFARLAQPKAQHQESFAQRIWKNLRKFYSDYIG